MRHKIVTCCLALMLGATARGATVTRDQIDALVQPMVSEHYCKGAAVGLIDASGRRVFGYGVTRSGGAAPDGQTVFEIGSVTKTFTATLLAQMVLSGEVKLDQPVKDLLPANVTVPQKDGVQITLLHLAMQRSGLPRMPDNFEPADPMNPYADYTPQKLYEALAAIELSREPGERYEYSNLGVGLLGHALSLKAGKRYEQLLVERICTPLGMNDTRITLDERLKSRLAAAHMGELVVANWDADSLAGAGAIRSTVDDMLTYLAAETGLVKSPLADAIKLTQQRRADAGEDAYIGLAWHIGNRTGTRWHDGGTGGYSSFVAFEPQKKVGVVVLVNSRCAMVDSVGTQLTKLMLGEPVEPLNLKAITPTTRPLDD